MHFENKSILITGASSGIGKALAELLSKKQCNLYLLSRHSKLIEDNIKKLNNPKAKICVYSCDVSNRKDVVKTYARIKDVICSIDISILNAGITEKVTLENYNSQIAQRIIGTNFFGIVHWVELLLPDYISNKGGTIVGISSLADNRGYSGMGFYSASKSAASIYLEGLRVDLKKHGVKVITVKPGFVKSPLTDKNQFRMPFIIPSEKAAQIIVRGIEKEKSIIQFPKRLVIFVKLIGAVPAFIFEFFAQRNNK